MKNAIKKDFSKVRKSIAAYTTFASKKPTVNAMWEIEVPELKKFCRSRGVSILPVIMKSIAHVNSKCPKINSFIARDSLFRRKIYYCNEVDMAVAMEKFENDDHFLDIAIIRDIKNKSIYEITTEIKRLKNLPSKEMPDAWIRNILLDIMPGFIKPIVLKTVSLIPWANKRFFGTIGLSNCEVYGVNSFSTLFVNSIGVGVGKIEEKEITTSGIPRVTPVIHISLTMDHALADGADYCRIIEELRRIFESGEFISICESDKDGVDDYQRMKEVV